MSSQGRYDGRVQNTLGQAISGASIAVLSQPANTSTQPGSPLVNLYNAATSNSATVAAGTSWSATTQQITFITSSAYPADIVVGSYVAVTGVNPSGYNGVWQVTALNSTTSFSVTTPYTLAAIANPGTWVSGGTIATSALPNPFFADTLGNFYFYVAVGTYTVQIYDTLGRISPLVLADQPVLGGAAGTGTVTSITFATPTEFTITGTNPITTSGTMTLTKSNENANTVWAGPTSGGAAAPTFRALVAADIPAGTGTVSSVAHTLSVPAIFSSSVTGSPITTSGTIADTIALVTQSANLVFAGPSSGVAATPAFRSLVAADLPNAIVALTSANLLALLSTPITLVAAPGTGFMIVPTQIIIKYYGGSSAYTDAGGAVTFTMGSQSATLANNNIFLVTTSPNRRIQVFPWPGSTGTAGNPPTEDNAALTISKVTNNFAAGNGTATILVWYYVVPTT